MLGVWRNFSEEVSFDQRFEGKWMLAKQRVKNSSLRK